MYGEGFDIGNLAPDQVGVGADGAREGVTAATGPSAALLLPPPEGVPAWLAALIERDGERAIIKAVLATIPGDRVMAITEELCSQRFGTEPILSDDSLAFQARAHTTRCVCVVLLCPSCPLDSICVLTGNTVGGPLGQAVQPVHLATHAEAATYRARGPGI